MYIQSFHIDNFGVFSDVAVEGLSPNLTVFLGKNEAGKSTCLEFLRTMLTGYPQRSSYQGLERDYTALLPDKSGQVGGSLDLYVQEHGLVRLVRMTRRPAAGTDATGRDAVLLTDSTGQVLESSLLENLLAGVTRDVYRNVFGFSLTELQVFESLKDEDVRHALYGASFGMGLRSPGHVLQDLAQHMDTLFKVQGGAQMNETLRRLERVQKEILQGKERYAQYDALRQQSFDIESELQNMRAAKDQLEQHRREAEKQLSVWKQWEEWRTLEGQLSRLGLVPEGFPEDGAGRLERAHLLRQEMARRVRTEQERYDTLEEKWAAFTVDERILEQRVLLQSLNEHKNAFRKAQEGLVPHMMHIQRTQSALQQYLTDLGPQWTCARIHGTDRSLAMRSDLERQVVHIQIAEQSQAAAVSALEKSRAAVTHARHQVELAQKDKEHLASTQIGAQAWLQIQKITSAQPIDKDACEDLRKYKSALENALQGSAEKEVQWRHAQHTFKRTLTPLSLRYMEGEHGTKKEDLLPQLEALKQIQDEALHLAHTAQELRANTLMAEQNLSQAQEKEDFSKGHLERLKHALHNNESTSRERVDTRARAIRSLRHLHTTLALEKERFTEWQHRLNTSTPPAPVKSTALMLVGGIVSIFGFLGLALPTFFEVHTLPFSEGNALPLSLWSGLGILLVGLAFFAGGLPRSGPDRKKFAQEMQALSARMAQMTQEQQSLETQIQEQCLLAEVSDADPITLDAVEILLEREREKCATEERMRLDLEQLEAEHQEFITLVMQKRQDVSAAQQQEQQALQRWHACLRAHHVHTIPSPEAAATFFARVEAALVAQAAMHNLEEDRAVLVQNTQENKELLCAMPLVRHALRILDEQKETPSAQGLSSLYLEPLPEVSQVETLPATQSLASLLPGQNTFDTSLYSEKEVLQAVDLLLESCRQADEALAERVKADAIVHSTEKHLEHALHEESQSVERLQAAEQALQTASQALVESLRKAGLDSDVAPSMLRSVLDCMDKCLSVEAEILHLQEEKERMEKECAYLVTPLRTLLETLALPLPEAAPSIMVGEYYIPYQEEWLPALDRVLEQLHVNQDSQTAKGQLQEQLHMQEEALHEAHIALADAESTMLHLLKLGQTDNMEEFIRLSHVRAERHVLEKRKQDVEEALRLTAGEQELEDFLQSFTTKNQHQCAQFLQDSEMELHQLVVQEQEKMQALAHTKAAVEALSQTDTLATLRQEEKNLQQHMHDTAMSWAKHAVAQQLLLQAKHRYEQERQPQVIRLASEIFTAITGEKWKGLIASLEENQLQVLSPTGDVLLPYMLSRGTQEQLYLSLRLAYIRHHANRARALPVIMDDVLVNFDPERATQTAKALLDVSQGDKQHQILFFTCHPHMADMLQDNAPQSKRFLVENHTIREVG